MPNPQPLSTAVRPSGLPRSLVVQLERYGFTFDACLIGGKRWLVMRHNLCSTEWVLPVTTPSHRYYETASHHFADHCG